MTDAARAFARARPWLTVLALAQLGGCAVGPNFHSPPAPTAATYAPEPPPAVTASAPGPGGEAQRFVQGAPVPARWWTAFGSPALDAMVDEALAASPDLKSAEAALRQSQALLSAQRGALLPSVELTYQAQRAKNGAALSPPLADNSSLYSLHTAQVTVAYPLDLFGGVRRQIEQGKAQTEAQRFQYEAARVSLAANVVQAAVQEASLRRQVEAARDQVAAARDVLALVRRQAALGALGVADVAAQEAQLAQAEQTLPPLEKSLAQQRAALAVLLGREPSRGLPQTLDLDAVGLPADLPLTLPSQLVRQRPDVRAAEANLHAASAGVGIAIAARLPSITLNGSAGGAAAQPGALLAHGDDFWSISAGLAQPLFQGGALLRRQRAAEAGLDQAKAQYRSAVLNAFKDVSNTLDALRFDADGLKAAQAAEAASGRSLALQKRQLELGQVGTLAVLNAQQAHSQAVVALAAARAARYADTTALFQALGGGWWDADR
ncbi:histidine kinase [Caulobacter sp. CCUG 60055]|uniref:efflux transporter outer membrane subunit n=1 Tax=Caulobacter sp. CCUG 60055 TaxID=2100090 RepID=UPI001FA7A4EB|nr:efflux transporter outer membrane subunit [Caulobacter sp. CCUG 60055]MCI3181638.1 histidine kinase [Caulobacter sp. CCUG 60055]